MAYVKTEWKDFPSEDTPITASALNNIEDGVEDLDTRLTTAEGEIDNLQTDVDNLQTDVDNLQNSSKVLYDNPSGTTGTITLNDSAANFTYIEIIYRTSNNSYDSAKIYNPDGKSVNLFTGNYYDNVIYNQTKTVNISGTIISPSSVQIAEGVYINGSTNTIVTNDRIWIHRVVGYR